jgi:hypothetical protein
MHSCTQHFSPLVFFFFSDGPARVALDDRTVWGVEVQVLLLLRRYRELAERICADVC